MTVGDLKSLFAIAEIVQPAVPSLKALDGHLSVIVVVETALNEIRTVVDVDFRDLKFCGTGSACTDLSGEEVTDLCKTLQKVVGAEKGSPLPSVTDTIGVTVGDLPGVVITDDEDLVTGGADHKSVPIKFPGVDPQLFGKSGIAEADLILFP